MLFSKMLILEKNSLKNKLSKEKRERGCEETFIWRYRHLTGSPNPTSSTNMLKHTGVYPGGECLFLVVLHVLGLPFLKNLKPSMQSSTY